MTDDRAAMAQVEFPWIYFGILVLNAKFQINP
jgi:hypothetical protein